MLKVTPPEYLEKHFPRWDRSDKVTFITVLEETLEAYDLSEAYVNSYLYQRWLHWRHELHTEQPFTEGEWYSLALHLLTLINTIGIQ